uniref:Uncharacterized protein n=1 Tax=Anguilla anguilla TaxID=7936 RepID=A0A0E9V912_ANGAN
MMQCIKLYYKKATTYTTVFDVTSYPWSHSCNCLSILCKYFQPDWT